MADLLFYEKQLTALNYRYIAGIDEAGRGPLAGPVAAACCIPDLSVIFPEINDSKQLSAKKREKLYRLITDTSIAQSVVLIDEKTIDEINILQATKRAMNEAVWSLLPTPDYLLVDAVKYDFGIPSKSIIHGDALSYCIAAASILAKVERDRIMERYAEQYPEYGFDKHKGYGTKFHIEMLKKYGPCPIHRKSFIKNFF